MKLAGIILAAGKGKRFKLKKYLPAGRQVNKVVLPIAGRPMILYAVELLEKLGINPIIVVVGFAKESVKKVLKHESVVFVLQKKPLGTGDAVSCGLKALPKNLEQVVVLNGDDALFLSPEIVEKLVGMHTEKNVALTLLTIELSDARGIGRVVRDKTGNVIAIIEEKDATTKQRAIREVNGLGYVFSTAFLKKYLPKLSRSKITGEYYLTSLVAIASENGEKIADFRAGKIPWRGINTEEELKEAELLIKRS